MLKALSIIMLISLALSACGGVRSPGASNAGVSVSSNSSISWNPPTEYVDHTPISSSDIGGYRIYVGTRKDNMRLITNISGSEETTFSLTRLGKGTHYITVTCYDTNGIESSFSTILVLNIY